MGNLRPSQTLAFFHFALFVAAEFEGHKLLAVSYYVYITPWK
jgi:hypothetical protein